MVTLRDLTTEPPRMTAPVETEGHPTFTVTDLRTANWAARRLQAEQRQLNEARAAAEADIDEVRRWLAEREAEHERRTSFLRVELASWHMRTLTAAIAEAGTTYDDYKGPKSAKLIGATVSARKGQPSWQAVDPDAFVAWAEANHMDDLVKVEKSPRIAAAKDVLTVRGDVVVTDDGEVAPGIAVVTPEINYSVKVEV